MQLILIEDVHNLGKSGELVSVKDGYGRNFLLPRKLAVTANERNVRQLEHQKAVIADKQRKARAGADAQAKSLGGVAVKIARKVGEQDKLFGSVTALDIAEALAAAGQKVDRRHIQLADPIKTIGSFQVEVRLHREVTAQVKVDVVPE